MATDGGGEPGHFPHARPLEGAGPGEEPPGSATQEGLGAARPPRPIVPSMCRNPG